MTVQDKEPDSSCNKPFVEHLDDLRSMIVRSVVFFVAGFIIAVPLAPYVLAFVKYPVTRAGMNADEFLRIIHIAGGFALAMRVIFWTGLLLSAPFILICAAQFIFPGLKQAEKRGVRLWLWATVLLFAAGMALCYYVTLPVAITMMFSINAWLGIEAPWVEIGDYIAFVLKLLIAFGAAFEVPVVIMTLGSMGLISSAKLRQYRRHAIVIILVAAMILTPPDVFTQTLMAVPMVLLYELCIWMIFFKEKKKSKM